MNQATDTGFVGFSPPLPVWALAALTLLSLIPLILAFTRVKDRASKFLVLAIWLRVTFDGWAFITLDSFGGVKPIAMLSLGTIAAGLVILDWRLWLHKCLVPFYLLVAVLMASGAINGALFGAIDASLRLLYLLVFMLALFQVYLRASVPHTAKWLLLSFSPAFLYQLAAIALGVVKFTENDGSAAYVGGFNHESAFSLLVIACAVVLRLASTLDWRLRLTGIAVIATSLIFANYRTAIIAGFPLLLWMVAEITVMSTTRRFKSAVAIVLGSIGIVGAVAAVGLSGDRYADVWSMVSNPQQFLKEPASFTRAEQREGSGRSYLFSQYFYAWKEAPATQYMIGRGPDSWKSQFRVYAQNTVLSYLYEVGLIGTLALMIVWLSMGWMALLVRWSDKGFILLTHIMFIVLNMSTMPFQLVDGLVLGGAIYGTTLLLYYSRSRTTTRNREAVGRRLVA